MRRTRTTKKLARRIDLQYFARPHTFRRWRFWLSVAIPVIAVGWFATQRAQGGQKVYSSGALATAHAVFTQQCGLCHIRQAGAFVEHVNEQACLACHDAPRHHDNQAFTPECSSCHMEHKGAMRLAAASTASCTQCHADLHARDGQPHYVAGIGDFDSKHPEFSALRAGKSDPGQIKLNHYVHLQPNLIGPNNTRVQMACEDCHRSANEDAAQVRSISATDVPHEKKLPRAYMSPPEYAKHCAACHTLQFDKRFGNEQTPHDKPEIVHAFLQKRFGEYIAAHPAAVYEVEPPPREIPERIRPLRVARSASEWVEFRVEDAEWLLWTKTCKQCHTLNATSGPLPEVAKSNITPRWLAHAQFDHHAHRMMSCTACHTRTRDSRETSDILLPGVQTCRQCHRESKTKESAEGRCFECHQYHDWSKAKPTKGRFTIPELRGSARLTLPQ
jgi:hypothetical protein